MFFTTQTNGHHFRVSHCNFVECEYDTSLHLPVYNNFPPGKLFGSKALEYINYLVNVHMALHNT